MAPPTVRRRLWPCALTPANRSVITAPLCPPLPSSSLGPGPTLPARRAAACWAGWVGHLGT